MAIFLNRQNDMGLIDMRHWITKIVTCDMVFSKIQHVTLGKICGRDMYLFFFNCHATWDPSTSLEVGYLVAGGGL